MGPDACEAVGLKLQSDRRAVGTRPAIGLRPLRIAKQILDVMAEFMGDDVGLRKFARRAQALDSSPKKPTSRYTLPSRGQ